VSDNQIVNRVGRIRLNEWISAAGLLIMSVLAPIALTTLKNLTADFPGDRALSLLRLSVAAFILVILLDILIAWSLKEVLKDRQPVLAHVTMGLRMLYGLWYFLSLIPLLRLGTGFSAGSYNAAFTLFETSWNAALGLFGVHLILLGILIFRSGFLSRILGVLVAAAGAGYSLDFLLPRMIPGFSLTISLFTFVGEVLLIIWLPVNARRSGKKPAE